MTGFKEFSRSDVLTSNDVNEYLMQQAVMVFSTESQRDNQLAGNLAGGLVAYVISLSALQLYDGSSWRTVGLYDDVPGITAESDVTKLIAMQADEEEITATELSPLFYAIFTNYDDGNWSHKIWVE